MQDFIGSVRRSLVFKPSGVGGDDGGGAAGAFGGFVEKIGSSIRKSRIGLFKPSVPALPPIAKPSAVKKEDVPPIRWRKGELIGCGAFGRVYMGMNLDSGELLAVKQVSIAVNNASKEKTQVIIGSPSLKANPSIYQIVEVVAEIDQTTQRNGGWKPNFNIL